MPLCTFGWSGRLGQTRAESHRPTTGSNPGPHPLRLAKLMTWFVFVLAVVVAAVVVGEVSSCAHLKLLLNLWKFRRLGDCSDWLLGMKCWQLSLCSILKINKTCFNKFQDCSRKNAQQEILRIRKKSKRYLYNLWTLCLRLLLRLH